MPHSRFSFRVMIFLLCCWSAPITEMEQTSSWLHAKPLQKLRLKAGKTLICQWCFKENLGRWKCHNPNSNSEIETLRLTHFPYSPVNVPLTTFWKKTSQATACYSQPFLPCCFGKVHVFSPESMPFPCKHWLFWALELVTELVELTVPWLK